VFKEKRNDSGDDVIAEVELRSCNQEFTQTSNGNSRQALSTAHTTYIQRSFHMFICVDQLVIAGVAITMWSFYQLNKKTLK